MQDSIANAILYKLRLRLAGDSPRRISHPGTSDPAAYDLYLRARHEFSKFEEGPLRESIKLYNQAIERDPRYPQAWAGIAESWLFLADDYVAPRIAYPAAKQAAEQALAFDSTLADAHAARGTALYSPWLATRICSLRSSRSMVCSWQQASPIRRSRSSRPRKCPSRSRC
jgi:adenylate cyclase